MFFFRASRPYLSKDDRATDQLPTPLCVLLYAIAYVMANIYMILANARTLNEVTDSTALMWILPVLDVVLSTVWFEVLARGYFFVVNRMTRGVMQMYPYEFMYPFRLFVIVKMAICGVLQLLLFFFPYLIMFAYTAERWISAVFFALFCRYFLTKQVKKEHRARVFLPMSMLYLGYLLFSFMGGFVL